MYTVTINGTTSFHNLRLNGNNFISEAEIKDADFPESPFTVVISDGESETTIENTELVQVKQYGAEWWFIIREILPSEMERRNALSQIEMLKEALNMILAGVTE